MIQMIVMLFPPVVVSDPAAIIVDMRPVRMSFAIAVDVLVPITPVVAITTVITIMTVVPVAAVIVPVTVRPVMRNVFMAVPVAVVVPIMIAIVVLRHPVEGKEEKRSQNRNEFLQSQSPGWNSPIVQNPRRLYHSRLREHRLIAIY
jgi:hypothetical protein